MNPDTFRWDPDQSVLWAGERSYPARFLRHSMRDDIPDDSDFLKRFPDYRFETRHAWVHFENRWQLSVIWGDGTYSTNGMSIHLDMGPFVEEPTQVEVGVVMPEPDSDPHLWGDPLANVTVPVFHRVADLVMMLPHDIDLPEGEWDDAVGFCDLLITAGLERVL